MPLSFHNKITRLQLIASSSDNSGIEGTLAGSGIAAATMRLVLAFLLALATSASACAVSLQGEFQGAAKGAIDYVCDETVPWLHHLKSSGAWADATPPAGTGCHAYVALTGSPPACTVGHKCPACAKPDGTTVSTIFLQGGTCEPCAPSTRRRSRELSRRHHLSAARTSEL